MEVQEIIRSQKEKLNKILDKKEIALGEIIYLENECQILSQSPAGFELLMNHQALQKKYRIQPADRKQQYCPFS